MLALAVLAGSFIIGFIFGRRPIIPVIGALILLAALPYVALPDVVGAGLLPQLHPATTLSVGTLLGIIILDYQRFSSTVSALFHSKETRITPPTWVLLTIVLVCVSLMIVTTLMANPRGNISIVLGQLVGPLFFAVLIMHCVFQNYLDLRRVLITVLAIATFEAVVAILVSFRLVSQPYLQSFQRRAPLTLLGGREFGLLDHYLLLGILCAIGVVLASHLIATTSAFALTLGVLAWGAVATQSRIAVVGVAVAGLYSILLRVPQITPRATAALFYIVTVISVSVFALPGSLAARINNDRGSTQARVDASSFVVDHLSNYLIHGVGAGSSKQVLISNGLSASPESAFLSYIIEYGLPLAATYFLTIAALLVNAGLRTVPTFCGALMLVSVQFYSSLSTHTAAAALLWTLVGCGVGLKLSRPASQNRHTSGITPSDGVLSK